MSSSTKTTTIIKRMVSGGEESSSSSSSSSFSSSSSRHQVYRGMSPTTASRLENRVKELEEALEQERSSHLITEKELSDLRVSFASLHETLDEAESETSAQIEINRRREQEFIKLKKDNDLLLAQHEASETNLKKRHQEIVNELNDQLERANKQRAKLEKEKQQITIEIESFSSQLDASNKAKSHAESKLDGLDEQLRRLKTQVDELTRQNQDLSSVRTRLTQENADLQRQLQDSEAGQGSANKIKLQLQAQFNETKTKLETEIRIRSQLEVQFSTLQEEWNSLRSQFDDVSEESSTHKVAAQKWQADFQQLKSKYDKDILERTDELEEIRRKLTVRISELETEVEQWKTRSNRFEKEKSKLTIEINEIVIQLETANNSLNDTTNRLKKAEHFNAELQRRTDELSTELRNGGAEHEHLLAELARLKQTVSDDQIKIDSMTRENTRITEASREFESSVKELTRLSHELTSAKAAVTSERDALGGEVEEARQALKDLKEQLAAANSAVAQSRTEAEKRLHEREEEIEGIKRSSANTIEDLRRTILEMETRFKSDANKHRKKYETELHEFEIQIDVLNRNNAELAKNNKTLTTKAKEVEASLEIERRAAQEARDSSGAAEKKIINLQAEIEDIRLQLNTSEKARKQAVADWTESTTRINEINITITSLTGDKRRLEGEASSAQRDRDEAVTARRAAEERVDKLTAELGRLTEQVRVEQETNVKLDSSRKHLETSFRELTVRMEELEATKDGKKSISLLQAQIQELERELENSSRREKEAVGENAKLKRQLQELRSSSEGDHRLVVEYTERINTLQTKIVTIRHQLEQSEEVLNITMGKYRKAQQMLEDAERRADRAESSVTIVRRQSVSTSGSRISSRTSVSQSRDTSRAMSLSRDVSGRLVRT